MGDAADTAPALKTGSAKSEPRAVMKTGLSVAAPRGEEAGDVGGAPGQARQAVAVAVPSWSGISAAAAAANRSRTAEDDRPSGSGVKPSGRAGLPPPRRTDPSGSRSRTLSEARNRLPAIKRQSAPVPSCRSNRFTSSARICGRHGGMAAFAGPRRQA